MPCHRCGVRQTDPERGKSPWRRGVVHDQLVLICPACQDSGDWTAELEHCARCRGAHLIRRLGQVECLDCGQVREPEAVLNPGRGPAGPGPADTGLADEVSRALDRVLGRA
jgi:DnaJ-class molecular chaperone